MEKAVPPPPQKEKPPKKAPTAEESKKKERKIFKAAVIDATKLVEAQARDIGDHRMTESKEDRAEGAIKRKIKQIWKHNIFQEYYRQKKIAEACGEILASGDLYAGEEPTAIIGEHDAAMNAIVARFTSEHENEMLKKTEKDSKKTLDNQAANENIKKLIEAYAADPKMSKEAFREEQKRILSRVDREYAKEGTLYASNLLDIATEIRDAVAHGEKLSEMDFEVQLTLGKAQQSLNTEAKETFFEKMQNSKVGRVVMNEPTVAAACAAAYGVVTKLSQRVASSKAVAWGSFGATAVLSGGLSAAKEANRIERERAQHSREKAKGKVFDEKDMPRREEMEKHRYMTREATEIQAKLATALEEVKAGRLDASSLTDIMADLADLETRVRLGDQKKIDLVTYSRYDKVEEERMNLDLARAELKVALRNAGAEKLASRTSTGTFDEYLDKLVSINTNALVGGESGIEKKDQLFQKMKYKKAAKAFVKTAVIGAVVGTGFQEAKALFTSEGGIVEGAVKSIHDHFAGNKWNNLSEHTTALEGLRRYMTGTDVRMPMGAGHEVLLGATHMRLPDGVDLRSNADGTYDILHGSDAVAKGLHLTLTPNGDLTEEAKKALAQSHIYTSTAVTIGSNAGHATESAADYIKQHPGSTHTVHRELWYDNDTPHPFDKNELKEWWGGQSGSGMNPNGDYVFNMKHMAADGSYHAGASVDAQAKMSGHGLKMLFSLSRGTQHQVFEVPIDANGNAVIPKDSEIAKLMFETKDGHAVFTGKFAEVAETMAPAKDGGETFRVLSTVVGHGKDVVSGGASPEVTVNLDIPKPWDYNVPPFIPIVPRTPLERGKDAAPKPVKKPEPRKALSLPEKKFASPVYYGNNTPENLMEEMKRMGAELDTYTSKIIDGKEVWFDKNGEIVKRDVERERERVRAYLDRQESAYLAELKSFAAKSEPMSDECRVSVNIPARFEAVNLKNLLDQYSQQVDSKGDPLDKNLFEINIIVNRKRGEAPDKSISIVDEWKRSHPGYHVNVIDIVFSPEKANVGMARKYITDFALMRSSARIGAKGPLYIESEDADLFSVDKRTIGKLISGFDEKPQLDVLRGIQDRQPEIMSKNDYFFFERRLWDMMEVVMRNEAYRPENMQGSSFAWNRVISGGWNTAYTAESYVEIGGYVPDLIGEDMKIGQKISLLRGSVDVDGKIKPNTHTAEASGLRSNSSPRRFIDALIRKENPYDNFESQALKSKTLPELMEGIKEYSKITPEQKQLYQSSINTLQNFISEQMSDKEAVASVLKRTLFSMGLKENQEYQIKNGKVELTDGGIPKITELLASYRKENRHLRGYKRQNSPEIENVSSLSADSAQSRAALLEASRKATEENARLEEEAAEKKGPDSTTSSPEAAPVKEQMASVKKGFIQVLEQSLRAAGSSAHVEDVYVEIKGEDHIFIQGQLDSGKFGGGHPFVEMTLAVRNKQRFVLDGAPIMRSRLNFLSGSDAIKKALDAVPANLTKSLATDPKKKVEELTFSKKDGTMSYTLA